MNIDHNRGAYGSKIAYEQLNRRRVDDDKVADFLLSPRYRVHRHLLLQSVILLITINVFWYEPLRLVSFWRRFGGFLSYFLTINVIMYTSLYVLVPHFLLKNRLGSYVLAAIVTSLVMITCLVTAQGVLLNVILPGEKHDKLDVLINAFSGILTSGFVMAGSAAVSLFIHWLRYNLRIDELESTTLQSELRFLKNQINPHFLFNMLNNANVLIKRNPQEASRVLFKLEDLLRYQIENSVRERVSLASDIRFLNDYLNLEKIRRDHFHFEVEQKGDIESIWIHSLLFIPFVENAVKHSFDSEQASYVHISFKVDDRSLVFSCTNTKPSFAVSADKVGGIGLVNIKRRLELLYPNNYKLEQEENENMYTVILSITL